MSYPDTLLCYRVGVGNCLLCNFCPNTCAIWIGLPYHKICYRRSTLPSFAIHLSRLYHRKGKLFVYYRSKCILINKMLAVSTREKKQQQQIVQYNYYSDIHTSFPCVFVCWQA